MTDMTRRGFFTTGAVAIAFSGVTTPASAQGLSIDEYLNAQASELRKYVTRGNATAREIYARMEAFGTHPRAPKSVRDHSNFFITFVESVRNNPNRGSTFNNLSRAQKIDTLYCAYQALEEDALAFTRVPRGNTSIPLRYRQDVVDNVREVFGNFRGAVGLRNNLQCNHTSLTRQLRP